MKKLVLSLFILFTLSITAFAQDRTVTGTVTSSEDGLPIPGVSVKVKEAPSIGGVTAADGKFSLRVPANGRTLIISYLGFGSKEVAIPASNVVNAALNSDAKILGEVIVTGVAAGTSREKLTISVTKISEERLSAVTATSVGNSLVGKVEGVRASQSSGAPGAGTNIQLRGNNNLPGVGSDPLILIDGAMYTGDLSSVNADDVESVEIVKGAAAASLYGSRAGNGVLAITTKRGKGLAVNSTLVNVRNELTLSQLDRKLELAEHHPFQLAADAANFPLYTRYAGVTYPVGYRDAGFSPGIAGSRAYKADHYADANYAIINDQQDALFNTGTNFTNYVSVSSKSEKGNVFASFENNQQKGVVYEASGYKRQNFRVNADYQLASWLKVSASNLIITTGSSSANNGFWTAIIAEPDANLFAANTDGQPFNIRINQFSGEQVNPLYRNYKNQNKSLTNSWLGSYSANVKFTKWLNADVSHSIEIRNTDTRNYNPIDTWNVDATAYTGGSLGLTNNKTNNQNTQATLNFNGKLSDLIINGKLSYLYENRKFDSGSSSGIGPMAFADIPQLSNFASSTSSSRQEVERAENYFAIASFDYKDRYLVDGMFRYDGSSLFGSDARWNPYYRISAAYRISKDVTIPGIDELKIRGAHGTAGIRPGYDWQYEYFSLANGVPTQAQLGNTLLKPSETAETEVGLTVNFLKKFRFDASYASSKTTDQFINPGLFAPISNGYPFGYKNDGTISSKTFEASMEANWVKKPDFSWTSYATFTRVRQKIEKLGQPPYLYGSTDGGGAQMFYIKEGETYGAMYGREFVHTLEQMATQLPAGKVVGDYEINSDGLVIPKGSAGKTTEIPIIRKDAAGANYYGKIGDGNSDFNIGLGNTFKYKDFTLYFLLDWKQGGQIYNSKAQWSTRDLRNGIVDQSAKAQGDKKTVDYYLALYDVNQINDFWVEDASYLKFRELAISYSLPKKLITNTFKGVVKGVTAKVMARNLFTITGYTGYDPEVGTVAEPYDGINKYPNYRSYGFSLGFDF